MFIFSLYLEDVILNLILKMTNVGNISFLHES